MWTPPRLQAPEGLRTLGACLQRLHAITPPKGPFAEMNESGASASKPPTIISLSDPFAADLPSAYTDAPANRLFLIIA
jgi:hypothetical protein